MRIIDVRVVDVSLAMFILREGKHRQKTEEFAAYLKELGQRKPSTQVRPDQEIMLFEKHFGPIDQNFIKQWAGYILKLKIRMLNHEL